MNARTTTATLSQYALRTFFVANAFHEAHLALLEGDAARAADRYSAGLAGLRRLMEWVSTEAVEGEWGEEETQHEYRPD